MITQFNFFARCKMWLIIALSLTCLNHVELAFQEDNDYEIIDLHCSFETWEQG